jgi:hypothetical protein
VPESWLVPDQVTLFVTSPEIKFVAPDTPPAERRVARRQTGGSFK